MHGKITTFQHASDVKCQCVRNEKSIHWNICRLLLYNQMWAAICDVPIQRISMSHIIIAFNCYNFYSWYRVPTILYGKGSRVTYNLHVSLPSILVLVINFNARKLLSFPHMSTGHCPVSCITYQQQKSEYQNSSRPIGFEMNFMVSYWKVLMHTLSIFQWNSLVRTDSGGFKGFSTQLFIFIWHHVNAQRKIVNGRFLTAEIKDSDFRIWYTTAEARLGVRLILAIAVTVKYTG